MKREKLSSRLVIILSVLIFLAAPLYARSAQPATVGTLSKGQSIYVPAYSHIYSGNNERPFLLAVTLSIRNIDPKNKITITAADYYATQGVHLKHFLEKPKLLNPMESLRYIVPESDKSGGSGANFIVNWQAEKPVNPPIVEAVMIGTQSQQGISFISRGREIIQSETEKAGIEEQQ